ncbi:hypothetical protein BVRB_9g203010 [Beta vulgaris subsp. vulgaris]|nr:hypothetical protein BVRB_9g203010 [Beta vulgaris subsp. vulgaris]
MEKMDGRRERKVSREQKLACIPSVRIVFFLEIVFSTVYERKDGNRYSAFSC